MANNFTEKKYLDFEGLSHFWAKVKEKFEAADSALKTELQGEFAAADSALKTELTTEINKKVAKSDYNTKMGQLDSAIDDINNTLGTLTGTDDFNELAGRVETLEGGKNSADKGKSVRTIANEELAAQLLGENVASDNFKTLQDLAAWLEDHPEEAAAMNQAIQANATAITTETTNRSNADIALGNRIQALEDAKYGDAISNAISQEAAAREAQDNEIEAAVGLTTEGKFTPNNSTNYVKDAINVRNEIFKLDAALKSVDTALTSHVNANEASFKTVNDNHSKLAQRVTTAEGEIDTLQGNVTTLDQKFSGYVTTGAMDTAFSNYDAKFVKITTDEIDGIFA